MSSPFEQFDIIQLILLNYKTIDISITNSTCFIFLTIFSIYFIFNNSIKNEYLINRQWQEFAEFIYLFILNLVLENVGTKGSKYFPLIFLTFIFILFSNLFGMLPYSFTTTSHIIVTCTLGVSFFLGITFIGIMKHHYKFLSLFFPPDIPFGIMLILVPIELSTYFSRALSLPVRLFANLMSGHVLLKILAGFATSMLSNKGLIAYFSILPISFIVAISGLELGIACLQAYVFVVLLCIYITDSLFLH